MDWFLRCSQRVKNTIHRVLGWVASTMLLILTLFALLEIIRRYIFSVVFEWGQDAIIVGMIAAVALYLAVTQVNRGHLVISVVIQMLHGRGYYRLVGLLKIFVSVVISMFSGAIAVTGWASLSYAWERDVMTYSLIIPFWPFYLILIIGFGLLAFVAGLQTVEDIISFCRGDHHRDDLHMTTDV